jgi:flavorubredoxin
MAEAVEDAFRYGTLVLATTTYNGGAFPAMKEFIHHLCDHAYQNRRVAFVENGSWAPMAAKAMGKALEGQKNLTFASTTVSISSALSPQSRSQIQALAEELWP